MSYRKERNAAVVTDRQEKEALLNLRESVGVALLSNENVRPYYSGTDSHRIRVRATDRNDATERITRVPETITTVGKLCLSCS
jgi:hypothetical protein